MIKLQIPHPIGSRTMTDPTSTISLPSAAKGKPSLSASIMDALYPPSLKYIRYCEGSVRVKIERRGFPYLCQHFKIRNYGSHEKALRAAVAWRDDQHMKIFSYPVSEKIYQLGNRRVIQAKLDPVTGCELALLPAGLSYSFHRGSLLYIVVSFQVDGKPSKQRFSIKTLGMDIAIEEAKKFRLGIFSK
jgi:hypothetical protein